MRNGSRKLFWLGFILMFFLGLIGGAYLVLRSTITHGELANSTPASQGKSSDELLDELLRLNEEEQANNNEYVPPEEKNLTDDFISNVVVPNGATQSSLNEVASDDFAIRTIIPYLESNKINLFPNIPDSVLKIVPDTSQNYQVYFKNTSSDVTKLLKLISEVLSSSNTNLPEDTDEILNLQAKASEIGDIFNNLSAAKTPQKLLETHKKMIVSAYAAQKITESLIDDEDPLKSIIIIEQMENAAAFWEKAFTEYENLSKKNQ